MRSNQKQCGWARVSALAGVAVCAAGPATAADLFEITTSNVGSGAVIPNVGDKSVPDLVEHLIDGTGAFTQLANTTFTSDLRYANIFNALRFDVTQVAGLWQAQLTSPFQPGLISRSFSAPTRTAVEDQIEDYLKKDGLDDLARFLRAVNERSALGVTHGNPISSTALTSAYTWSEYGTSPTATAEEKEEPKETGGRLGFAMVADAGFIQSQGLAGQAYSYTPFVPVKLSSRVRLDVGLPLNYTEIEGAQIFRAGGQLALPVLLAKRTYSQGKVTQPWFWQVTPSGGSQVSGSLDMVAGGVINNFGLTSLLGYDFGWGELSMGNQLNHFESLEVTFGDYSFDPKLSTQIVKNGLKLGVPFAKRWYAEFYALDTEMLGESFMARYATVGGGIGYKFLGKPDSANKKKGYLMVGAYANIGKEFTGAHFQLGSGWKF